jgi:hypothetical protein
LSLHLEHLHPDASHAPRPRQPIPETTMAFNRPIAGRSARSRLAYLMGGVLAAAFFSLNAAASSGASDRFPFDQELLLDVAPMRPAKRVPILMVDEDGRATIDLWCKTVPARVQISDSAIRIETAPLPDALPQYMSDGQCSDARMQADVPLLAALTQMTEWRRKGDGVVLSGPPEVQPMRFRASSH